MNYGISNEMTNTFTLDFLFCFYFLQACKDKRVYVNIPMSNEELGRSNTFTTPEDQIKIGGETKTLNTEEEEKEDCNEEILTPGNLMAFAWHVCQGMVSKTAVISSEEKPPKFALLLAQKVWFRNVLVQGLSVISG